ncbi:MAG TPA: hypothetical protein DET40_16090 [Lentisphaeria bacterium]|nr:hypothetical protein [Lentisphaeria bacterium]
MTCSLYDLSAVINNGALEGTFFSSKSYLNCAKWFRRYM